MYKRHNLWMDKFLNGWNKNIAGWWFGTFFIFPYIGNNHPNWLIFFRGVETTNQIGFFNANGVIRAFPNGPTGSFPSDRTPIAGPAASIAHICTAQWESQFGSGCVQPLVDIGGHRGLHYQPIDIEDYYSPGKQSSSGALRRFSPGRRGWTAKVKVSHTRPLHSACGSWCRRHGRYQVLKAATPHVAIGLPDGARQMFECARHHYGTSLDSVTSVYTYVQYIYVYIYMYIAYFICIVYIKYIIYII